MESIEKTEVTMADVMFVAYALYMYENKMPGLLIRPSNLNWDPCLAVLTSKRGGKIKFFSDHIIYSLNNIENELEINIEIKDLLDLIENLTENKYRRFDLEDGKLLRKYKENQLCSSGFFKLTLKEVDSFLTTLSLWTCLSIGLRISTEIFSGYQSYLIFYFCDQSVLKINFQGSVIFRNAKETKQTLMDIKKEVNLSNLLLFVLPLA